LTRGERSRTSRRVAATLAVAAVLALLLTAFAAPVTSAGAAPVDATVSTTTFARASESIHGYDETATATGLPLALSASSAGSVVKTAYINYNATTTGNFPGSVLSWDAGTAAVDPVTDQLWIPEWPIPVDHLPTPESAPALVYSPATNLTETISSITNTSSIAFDPITGDLYATDILNNSVLVIDPTTQREVGPAITVGAAPKAILYDPISENLFVANAGSNNVTVINGTLGDVQIPGIAAGLEPIALADDTVNKLLFVADGEPYLGTYNISLISTQTNLAQSTHIPLADPPSSVAYSESTQLVAVATPASNFLTVYHAASQSLAGTSDVGFNVSSVVSNLNGTEFVAANDTVPHLILVPASTGAITPSFVTTVAPPWRLTVNPVNGLLYLWSATSRTVTSVNLVTNTVVSSSPDLAASAETLVYDQTAGNIFVADSLFDSVEVLNATTLSTSHAPIIFPSAPISLEDNPGAGIVYVAFNGGVAAVNARNGAIETENTALSGNNSQLVLDQQSNLLWDVNQGRGLASLELPTLAAGPVAGLISGGINIRGVALDPATNTLFAVDLSTSTIFAVNGSTGAEVGSPTSVIPGLISVAYDPADNKIYALGRSVWIVEPATHVVEGGPIAISPHVVAWSIVYDPSREYLYVTSNSSSGPPWPGNVTAIDGASVAASEDGAFVTIAVGQLPLDLQPVQLPGSSAPGSGEILVANFISGTLSVIASQPTISYFAATPNPVDVGVRTSILLGFTGGAGPSSISYSGLPGSCTSGNVTELNCTPTLAGSYTIQATVTDSLGSNDSATTVLSVSPSLQVEIVQDSLPQGEVDLGNETNFSASVAGGSATYNYSWQFGDSSIGWGKNVEHTYATTGVYLVTLTIVDSGGGVSSATSSITVVPRPSATVVATPSNVTDVNQSIGFNAAVSGGTTPGNASWSFGDGTSATGTSVEHRYSTSGVYFARFHYRDASGVNVSQFISVVVNPALSATLAVATTPANTAVTTGTLLQFTTSISGGTEPYTVVWGFDDGSYGYGVSSQHAFATAGTYTVTLFVEDAVGASWNTTYRVVVAGPSAPSMFGADFDSGLLLGLLVGATIAAVILFLAARSKKRPPAPPTAYVPPAEKENPASPHPWQES
jgi:DNA-binding beta-propeller fold protein YncE/PKD repeat protein